MNTEDHADEAIRGLQESGIRSVFAFGFANTSLQDWWFGPDYAGSVLTIDGDRPASCGSSTSTRTTSSITMALATRGTGLLPPEVVRQEWELAKELGLNITVHVAMYRFGYTKMQLRQLEEIGPALSEHDLHPLVALHRRGVGAGPRLGRQRLVRARRSSSRWATAGRRP